MCGPALLQCMSVSRHWLGQLNGRKNFNFAFGYRLQVSVVEGTFLFTERRLTVVPFLFTGPYSQDGCPRSGWLTFVVSVSIRSVIWELLEFLSRSFARSQQKIDVRSYWQNKMNRNLARGLVYQSIDLLKTTTCSLFTFRGPKYVYIYKVTILHVCSKTAKI